MHFITHERQYLTASTLRQASTSKVHEEMLLELQLHAAGYRRKLALPMMDPLSPISMSREAVAIDPLRGSIGLEPCCL